MAIKITKYDKTLRKVLLAKRGPICERCNRVFREGNTRGLHCSHFFGRANWAVRLDEDNVDLHCHGCHAYLTANPQIHTEWKQKQLGEERFFNLARKAKSVRRWLKGEKDEWNEQQLLFLKGIED